MLDGFGAALLTMFMRAGIGTYTTAADVGADLVGKADQDIPEDDPSNAATHRRQRGRLRRHGGRPVGVLLGHAGGPLILGKSTLGEKGPIFPLIVPAIVILTVIAGIFLVAPRSGDRSGMTAINRSLGVRVLSSLLGGWSQAAGGRPVALLARSDQSRQ